MRNLVFAEMPQEATPSTHIPAGTWCFTSRENIFPAWYRHFQIPEDPFPTPESMHQAACSANATVWRLIQELGTEANAKYKTQYSPNYWEMVFAPWLIPFTHMLLERQTRLVNLIASHGEESLRVTVLPESTKHSFATTQDFTNQGVLGLSFNHYIFSRMLETMAPATWTLEYIQASPQSQPAIPNRRSAPKEWLFRKLLELPFPWQKGFSAWQCLCLSLAVLKNQEQSDNTRPFTDYTSLEPCWLFPIDPLIKKFMPQEIATTIPPKPGSKKGKLRGMTAVYSQIDSYRFSLAAWREGGGRLFSIQHGANYGNLYSVGMLPMEYKQHAFFTWGWHKEHHIPANPIPMPHPLLWQVSNAHKENQKTLIMVGTEMSTFTYRLKSRPWGARQIQYRNNKVVFLKGLGQGLLSQVLYRPYFSTPSGLADADFVCTHVPGLQRCTGDLNNQVLSCRLLVLDHYGTTLHTAMAANIPTLCFWDSGDWGVDQATQQYFEQLRQAGILFDCPEDAAEAANSIWGDVQSWWQAEARQKARLAWLNTYALPDIPGHFGSGQVPSSPLGFTRYWYNRLVNC